MKKKLVSYEHFRYLALLGGGEATLDLEVEEEVAAA
jgi:hypothetical protein